MPKCEVILTVGCSGSGKTTWAIETCKRFSNYRNVNRDDLRLMLFGVDSPLKYKYTKEKEKLVESIQRMIARETLSRGLSIIISDTNLKEKHRVFYKELAKEFNAVYTEQVFNESFETLKKRNFYRGEKAIPLSHLRNQFYLMQEYMGQEVYKPNTMLPKAVIFDIDGTLADKGGRHPFDWTKVKEDKPRPQVIEMLKLYRDNGYRIITCSGREDVCEEDTLQWLREQGIEPSDHFQRETNDRRPDHEVKKEIFFSEIAPRYHVVLAVDDRDQVVDMYRAIGVECFQVNYGDF